VLIDDSGKALLCDFGLARLKADITTRTTETEAAAVAGSRHWMAPERLMGKSLRKPCDVYAFGITSYEVILNLGREYILWLNDFTRFMPTRFHLVISALPKFATSLYTNTSDQKDQTAKRLLS
jgi:serine/threonine protein kinase